MQGPLPQPKGTSESNEQNKTIAVQTVSVVQQEIQRTSMQPATVHPFYRAEVRARISGYVKTVHVDMGDFVEEGTVLAEITVPEMEQQRQIIKAKVKRSLSEEQRAQAGVALAEANIQSSEARLIQARSELSRAQASLAAAEAEFNRTSDLVERQSLESRLLDEVRKKRDSELANNQAVQSAINSAQADVAVAKSKLVSAQADLNVSNAEIEIARSELAEHETLMEYATLKAPFSGLITTRTVEPGSLVRESSEVGEGQPLFVISQVDKVRVHIPVPEADAPLVSHGDEITLRFPSFPAEAPLKTTVTRVSGDLDPHTRTMLVESVIENPDNKLMPGMFGEASILLSSKMAANVLPARAIRFSEAGEAFVYVVAVDQTVTMTPISTGFDNGHTIEVTQGLEQGQTVIDAHLKRFENGQKVMLLSN